MKNLKIFLSFLAIFSLIVLLAVSTMSCKLLGLTNDMTDEQALALSQSMTNAAISGFSTAKYTVNGMPAASILSCPPQGPSMVRVVVENYVYCNDGGYIHVIGDGTGNFTNKGSGMIQVQVVESIVNWKCESGFTVNGAPYLSAVATFTFMNWQPATRQDMTIGGGYSWGTKSSQTCNIHLTVNFSLQQGTAHMSGSVCDKSVDVTY
jgi:hypothetical protein